MGENRETPSQPSWRPPSDMLVYRGGTWVTGSASPVSYPDWGNDFCSQVEETSFWFRHRTACILESVRQFPPGGTLFDIGGGNGLVASALQAAGTGVALVEPGSGARNAVRRGIVRVVESTFEDARFHPQSLPAAGAFDVVEHTRDDLGFLAGIRNGLVPGGRLYCTVPALPVLWSSEDVRAGHFRRYTRSTLVGTLRMAGFDVEFASYFFSWLGLPVFFRRAVPYWFGRKAGIGTSGADPGEHRLPAALSAMVDRVDAWELGRIRAKRPIPHGTSLLCVARAGNVP